MLLSFFFRLVTDVFNNAKYIILYGSPTFLIHTSYCCTIFKTNLIKQIIYIKLSTFHLNNYKHTDTKEV